MRIGINGFGRIGRQVMRIAADRAAGDIDIVHVNDIVDASDLAHLLKYDTTYGVWNREVKGESGALHIDGKAVSVSTEKDPSKLPWGDKNVDVVLEATGAFRKKAQARQHIDAGAKKVLISAPAKDEVDGEYILGVNDDQYDAKRHHIITIGSCTTNGVVPVAKVLHESFTIVRGCMTTAHAYTATQNLLDGPHKDPRRARAAAENIIPTSTGAAQMIGRIIPELDGKVDGLALRVPIKCGSIIDLTVQLEKEATAEQINAAMKQAADTPLKGILQYAEDPIVSSDIVGNPHSSIFVPQDTMVIDGAFAKVLAWYDNEWGFSSRVVDMISRML
jgi:glyceraldehyde 3-phosphate dehydrogenase